MEFKMKICYTYCCFMIVVFLETVFTNLNSLSENMSRNNCDVLKKKRGMHFIHININSLVRKIDELRYIVNITNSSIIGISETKLDETILPSELEGRWLWFNKTWSIKVVLLVTVKDSFSSNIESIFVGIYLPKSKPILLCILCKPPDKSDFVKRFNNALKETGVLDKQECYLLGDLNINLLLDEK